MASLAGQPLGGTFEKNRTNYHPSGGRRRIQFLWIFVTRIVFRSGVETISRKYFINKICQQRTLAQFHNLL